MIIAGGISSTRRRLQIQVGQSVDPAIGRPSHESASGMVLPFLAKR